MNVTLCLFIHLLKDVLIVSTFGQLWIKLLWILMCRCFLCEHKFLIHLGKYWGEKLLDHVVRVCLVLYETAKLSSRVTVRFIFSPAVNERVPVVCWGFLILVILVGEKWYPIFVLICIPWWLMMLNFYFHAILYWGNIGL